MTRDLTDYFVDILTSLQEIEEFTLGIDYATFQQDKKTINAVLRSLEVMGEAAKRIPENIRMKYPDIPWKRMTGMRDKLIHEYSGVDLDIVWGVIKDELPLLKPSIEKVVQDMNENDHKSSF